MEVAPLPRFEASIPLAPPVTVAAVTVTLPPRRPLSANIPLSELAVMDPVEMTEMSPAPAFRAAIPPPPRTCVAETRMPAPFSAF